ncbi:MAG: hypothetical protein IT434_02150 [Phycisphaerales bacterium]|jgi:hypothetical protein|nr:hypothetical protein [Phycisphaerales bacterium]
MFERGEIPIELQKRRTASRWWLSVGAVVVMLAWGAGMIASAAVSGASSRVGASGQIEGLPPFIAGILCGIGVSAVVRVVLRRRVDTSNLLDVDSVVLAANGAGLLLAAMVEFVEMIVASVGA